MFTYPLGLEQTCPLQKLWVRESRLGCLSEDEGLNPSAAMLPLLGP